MKRKTVKCPYCGAQATLRPAAIVHGEKAVDKFLYICSRYPACDSYVGVHRHNLQPKGTLANKALRIKRMQAHSVFDQLWKTGLMPKSKAYVWMQAKLGLDYQQAHIAKFSEYTCDKLITLCRQALDNYRLAHPVLLSKSA